MPSKGTPPTQMRLTEENKAEAEAVRVYYGLPSIAAAIRYAVHAAYLRLAAEDATHGITPEKSKKKSK